EPVERPDVVRVLQRARQSGGDAQVVCVNLQGLLDSTLLEEQSAQRVPDRLHPSPWLVVRQVVRELHGVTEARERALVFALPVLERAVQHRRRDLEDVAARVVEDRAAIGHALYRGPEGGSLFLRPPNVAQRG